MRSPAEVQFVPTAVASDAELLHPDDGVWASELQGASVPYWVQTHVALSSPAVGKIAFACVLV